MKPINLVWVALFVFASVGLPGMTREDSTSQETVTRADFAEASILRERCGDKKWLGNRPEDRAWLFRYEDQDGGQNYWCISPGTSCHLWDWWVHYPGAQYDPCTEINYRTYGLECAQAEAAKEGFDLPPDYDIVQFINTFVE